MKPRFFAAVALLSSLTAGWAHAQETFPEKPIHIAVPFSAGSGSDSESRWISDKLTERLGQPVVVENRPGGSGQIAAMSVKNAPADGYTILLASNSPMVVNPLTVRDLAYDPFTDFKPLVGLFRVPPAFIVPASSPYRTIGEFITTIRETGDPVAMGNYSDGYLLIANWLGIVGDIEIDHIAYRGGAQVIADLMGNHIDIGVMDPTAAIGPVRDGQLRVLATAGDERHPMFPDAPTMIEAGYSDFEIYVWASFFVHSDTPENITQYLADTLFEILDTDEYRERAAQFGYLPLAMKTDDMRSFQQDEYERFRRVAETIGYEPQ